MKKWRGKTDSIRIKKIEENKKRMMYEQNYLIFVDKLRTVQNM